MNHLLIPTVADQNRVVRLDNLQDEPSRQLQCQVQGVEIDWKKDPVDWCAANSLLAAPIESGAQVVGVIQLGCKRRQASPTNATFADQDQRLLKRLAKHCIGPKLETLINADERVDPRFCLKWAAALHQLKSDDGDDFSKKLLSLLRQALPENGCQKLYLISLLSDDGKSFRTLTSMGGLDKPQSNMPGIYYPLADSITGRAVSELDGRAIFWNERANGHDWFTPRAVCGLACKIQFNQKPIGAIVVKSDCYDLSLKRGIFLESLAEQFSIAWPAAGQQGVMPESKGRA